MDRKESARNYIAGEAVDWFVLLRETEVSSQERSQFSEWLLRSPVHIQEYLAVARAWGEVGAARSDDLEVDALVRQAQEAAGMPANVVEFPVAESARETKSGESDKRSYALAASVVIAVLGVGGLGLWAYDHWVDPARIRSAVGEQRIVTLADGSMMNLNTGSEVRVRFDKGQRRIELIGGEARFTVARDAVRPFVVDTADARVRALGTVFNVRALNGQTAVAVFEGRVAVEAEHASASVGPATELAAGQRASILAAGQIVPEAGPTIERASSWVHGQLTFVDEPLEQIVSELNRYRREPIVIADAQTAAVRVSGTYGTAALPDFLQYLAAYRHVHARPTSEGGYILSRAQP